MYQTLEDLRLARITRKRAYDDIEKFNGVLTPGQVLGVNEVLAKIMENDCDVSQAEARLAEILG